jgi:hypothetical protein
VVGIDVRIRPPMRRVVLLDLFVVSVAVAVRVASLLDARDAPDFANPIFDAAALDEIARAIADGGGVDCRLFLQSFLYPLLLGVLYMVPGASILSVKILQLLLGVATCWLTARIGRHWMGPIAGACAGTIVALHGPVIFFEGELLATTLSTFLVVLLLHHSSRIDANAGAATWAKFGALGAIAVLTLPTLLLVLAIAGIVALSRGRVAFGLRVRCGGAGAVTFLALTLPVAWLSARTCGDASSFPPSLTAEFHLSSVHDPCAMLGGSSGAPGQERIQQVGVMDANSALLMHDRFRTQLEETLRTDPGAIPRGVGRKSLQLVTSRELPRDVDPYMAREESWPLRILMGKVGPIGLPMALLLPLAVLGMVKCRNRLPWMIPLFVLLQGLAIVIVFVSARDRIPLVPALALLAVAGASAFAVEVQRRRWRSVAVSAGILTAAVLLATLPGPFCEEERDMRADTLFAVGHGLHRRGDLDRASQLYAAALEEQPDHASLIVEFGVLRRQQGREDEAERLWRRALSADPDHEGARLHLGRALLAQERYEVALEQFENVLARHPNSADALSGSGFALLELGRFSEAVARLESAFAIRPSLARQAGMVPASLEQEGEHDLARRLQTAIDRAMQRTGH